MKILYSYIQFYYLCRVSVQFSKLMTPFAIFPKHLMNRTSQNASEKVTVDLVSQSASGGHTAASLSGLGENNLKAHQNREKAPGKSKLLTHISAPLKHVKNAVRLETSTCKQANGSNET